MNSTDRFERAMAAFDAANAEDPNREVVDGVEYPKELLYGRRMSEWVETLDPQASEALRLAARSQHILRWEIPRTDYPMDRAGYHRWRTRLYSYHAEIAGAILRDMRYDDETIVRVQRLLHKKNLKTDPDAQTLEDAAALVFLQYHLGEFAERDDVDDRKLIRILRKTWSKMSDRGHAAALELELSPAQKRLVEEAVGQA